MTDEIQINGTTVRPGDRVTIETDSDGARNYLRIEDEEVHEVESEPGFMPGVGAGLTTDTTGPNTLYESDIETIEVH